MECIFATALEQDQRNADMAINPLKDPIYYAKILLFGEYGIIEDSMGLSIPYNSYKGKFVFESGDSLAHQQSNAHLQAYLKYLKGHQEHGTLPFAIRLDDLEKDILNGMSFDSDIPQGFGVGSSGALVAAIYERYAVSPIKPQGQHAKDQILELKAQLGFMESYFHGKSSGLDPLICYLNFPVLIRSKGDVDTIGIPQGSESGKGAIFLLNSGSPGETQPMVNIFMERMKQEGFRNMIRQEFKKYNDACIQAFLNRDMRPLFSNMRKLSTLVFEHFSPMIPGSVQEAWKKGIESNDYYLKLCGSGGGGFVLGFTKDLEKAKSRLQGHHLEVIYSF